MTHGPTAPDPVTVGAIRLPPPLWLDDEATVRDVAGIMCRAGISAVIIGPDASIVTERDVVRALAEGDVPDAAAIRFASAGTLTVGLATPVVDALARMLHAGVRHAVVVDALGVPCAVLPLAAAAAVVLDASDVPNWLSALRIVLRLESVDP